MRCRRATVLEALHKHPLIVHNSRPRRASRWSVVRAGSDLRPVHFSDSEVGVVAAAGHVAVVCPDCGCTHSVVPGHARKIERGLRSARCESCADLRITERPPLTEEERGRFVRWWITNFSDEELADFALALGVEGACVENVAANRARLARPGEARARYQGRAAEGV